MYDAGGSDAVRMSAGLSTITRVGRLVFQLGKGGGRDPPYAFALAPLLQKHAEVNPRANTFYIPHLT